MDITLSLHFCSIEVSSDLSIAIVCIVHVFFVVNVVVVVYCFDLVHIFFVVVVVSLLNMSPNFHR